MLNESPPAGGVAGGAAAGVGQQQGVGGGAMGQPGAQGQGTPYTTIQVTAEEKEAIERV